MCRMWKVALQLAMLGYRTSTSQDQWTQQRKGRIALVQCVSLVDLA